MEKEAIIIEAKRVIRKYLPAEYRIVLFGSWVRGNALPTSDIDIGIVGNKKVPWNTMVEILQEIDMIRTLRSIDVVDLNAVEKRFQEEALKSAQPL